MSELLLIVRLAGRRVALRAAEVESVVELEGLTPVPRAAPHVAGLSALRSRVLTVIDAAQTLEPDGTPTRGCEAVVIVCDGHPYALLVEGVEDVIEAVGEVEPVGSALAPGWRRAALGMAEAGGDLLLLVDVGRLVAGPAESEAA